MAGAETGSSRSGWVRSVNQVSAAKVELDLALAPPADEALAAMLS